jgi:chromobox protein 5
MILDQPKGRQGKAGKKNETFIIKKILNKRIIGKKNEYLIWWKGYPKTEATWEPENNLPVDIVKEFNQN